MVIRFLISGLLVAGLSTADAVAAEPTQNATVSEKDCRLLVAHQPAADVAYKPGVGVRGRPVKPADVDSDQRIDLPQVIAIPLHVPLRRFPGIGVVSPIGDSEAGVGLVTVDRTSGEVKYEGKTLVQSEKARVVAACRKLLRQGR
ncbi:MAG: hypothetical protein O2967_21890 [Proteobacteria bacterium]|nr:hypothetical protein [Pseudomonadota bacterium]